MYLLRDNDTDNPAYTVFATYEDERVIEKTAYHTPHYIDATLQAHTIFTVLMGLDIHSIACYIESEYENTYHVSYSVDALTVRKTSNQKFYTSLIETYEASLGTWSPQQAFARIVKGHRLNIQQQGTLKRLINVQTVLSTSFN